MPAALLAQASVPAHILASLQAGPHQPPGSDRVRLILKPIPATTAGSSKQLGNTPQEGSAESAGPSTGHSTGPAIARLLRLHPPMVVTDSYSLIGRCDTFRCLYHS